MKTIYKDGKEWRWQVKARNGKIISASTESFKRRAGAEKNFRLATALMTLALIGLDDL